ncbi:MAG TPA: hypothetical protein VFS00_10100 [Polyangiaceae bacterium]|nr:hypothetical protein [Polyangiaceae bacterium]
MNLPSPFERLLPDPRARQRAALAAAGLALVGLLIWQRRHVGDWRVDDAYISYSFAKNLAAGRGLVFSHGERVEGYSNFLWVVLCSPAYLVGMGTKIYGFARMLAWGFLGLLFASVDRIVRRRAGVVASFFALALLAVTTDLVRAVLSGLESVPYAALVAAGAAHYLTEDPARRRHSIWWFIAAGLMRIDGFVPLAFVLGFELVASIYERRFSVRALARWAGPGLLVYGLYFGARWAYYGLPLPTTYYAKNAVTTGDPYRGFKYLRDALTEWGAPVALAFGALALRRPTRESLYAAGFVVYYAAYVAATGGDWMPFNRFALPLAPFLAALFVWGLAEARRYGAAAGPTAFRLAAGLGAAAYLFVAARVDGHVVDTKLEEGKQGMVRHVKLHTRENLLATLPWMRHVVRQPGDKLVTDYAGVFSVYTEASVIDMWGLCNAAIALRGTTQGVAPVYGKTCLPCYREFEPDYFHVMVPLVRAEGDFTSQAQVIAQIFQGPALDREIDLKGRYATGRVRETATGRSLYFLERRRPDRPLVPRAPAPGVVVEYPFEPGGLG